MFAWLANPARFMAWSRRLAPAFGLIAAVCLAAGLWLIWTVPDDYQQGPTVKILFIHVPAVSVGMLAYVCLGGMSFFGLVFRHSLADTAAKALAPIGAAFTALGLATGSLWGRPMWGTWWEWGDARLTSFLVLLLFYLGYMALHAAIDDEGKAARAAAILALVGLINLPIVHFSVEWWSTLHQGATVLSTKGPGLPPVYLWPLALMAFGYIFLFLSVWLVRTRAEVWRRRAGAQALAAAG
ncbi:MAG: heme ABC transporter permease CcmC [Caulobacteraceae bacterium]